MTDRSDPIEEKPYWLDQRKNIFLIVCLLYAICAILFFADAFYHKHSHFEIEQFFGFYGIYGFFVCVTLILIAKSLRAVLMRAESYYDGPEQRRRASDRAAEAND
jgi:uncharacterized membrane protein